MFRSSPVADIEQVDPNGSTSSDLIPLSHLALDLAEPPAEGWHSNAGMARDQVTAVTQALAEAYDWLLLHVCWRLLLGTTKEVGCSSRGKVRRSWPHPTGCNWFRRRLESPRPPPPDRSTHPKPVPARRARARCVRCNAGGGDSRARVGRNRG
jgi:hypothetical protein